MARRKEARAVGPLAKPVERRRKLLVHYAESFEASLGLTESLFVSEFSQYSPHEIAIQLLKIENEFLPRRPRFRWTVMRCVLGVPPDSLTVRLDIRENDNSAEIR
jgi:hypothetical protein